MIDEQPRDRCLVTGASGSIGSGVIAELKSRGFRVRSLVRRPPLKSLENVVLGDVLELGSLEVAMQDVDVVYHLAGIGSPASPTSDHPRIVEVNAIGTSNVIAAAARANVRRVVLASSSAVYGRSGSELLREDGPFGETSVYGASKRIAERQCLIAREWSDMEFVILRYFNVYGSPYDEARLIPTLVQRMSKRQRITIFGNGEQQRDFVHISDVARVTVDAGSDRNIKLEVLNVGTGVPWSILDIVKAISGSLGVDPDLEYAPSRSDDVEVAVADVSRLETVLGYRPSLLPSEGIPRYVATLENGAGNLL